MRDEREARVMKAVAGVNQVVEAKEKMEERGARELGVSQRDLRESLLDLGESPRDSFLLVGWAPPWSPS